MALFLAEHDLLQPGHQILIAVGAVREARLEVVLMLTEQAGADFAVRCEPESVAISAERLRDRGNDPDLGCP
jgi:hypothetical protein